MADEERWMRLYVRALELERERAGFESRCMEQEDRLSGRVREDQREEERRVLAVKRAREEKKERVEMEAQDKASALLVLQWREEVEDLRRALEQRELAASLLAGTGGLPTGTPRLDQGGVLLPEPAWGLAVRWERVQRMAVTRGTGICEGHRRWEAWAQQVGGQWLQEAQSPPRRPRLSNQRPLASSGSKASILTQEQVQVRA